jgi:hypothetical protein
MTGPATNLSRNANTIATGSKDVRFMNTEIICCFAKPWFFPAKTLDSAEHGSLRLIVSGDKIHLPNGPKKQI